METAHACDHADREKALKLGQQWKGAGVKKVDFVF